MDYYFFFYETAPQASHVGVGLANIFPFKPRKLKPTDCKLRVTDRFYYVHASYFFEVLKIFEVV